MKLKNILLVLAACCYARLWFSLDALTIAAAVIITIALAFEVFFKERK